MKNLAFEDSGIEIYVRENTVYFNWLRTVTLPEFKEALIMGVLMIRKYGCTQSITDARLLGTVPAGGQEWIEEVLNPEILESGLKKIAIVYAEDIFNQLSVESYAENSNNSGVITQIFKSVEGADDWMTDDV